MTWPQPDEIIFSEKTSALTKSSVWRLTISKLNFTEIIPPTKGLLVKWLENGEGIELQNQQSSLINWAGQSIGDFPFLVLPDKCAWKTNALYCFLFSTADFNPKTNWPDDYFQNAIATQDALYKINSNNLASPQLIFSPEIKNPLDATNLKILGQQILFLNRYDNQLYSLGI